MKEAIVLYYSLEGNTKLVADFIGSANNIKVIEIKPIVELKSKGLAKYFWGGKDVIMGRKPHLKPLNIDLSKYDIIFIGSPIWAGTYAPPIKTLLDDENLKGKSIAYFYTHDGGFKNAEAKFKLSIEPNNKLLSSIDCLSIKQNKEQIRKKVTQWSKEILTKYKLNKEETINE